MPKKQITPEMITEYKKMVQAANKRLYRIESDYSKRPGYQAMKEYAYAKAQQNIRAIWGDQKRFSKAVPTSYREYQKAYNALNEFMESKTGTLSDLKGVYERRANTLNDKYGWGFSWQDLAKMFESGMYEKLKAKGYGSETTFKAIALMSKEKNLQKFKNTSGTVKVTGGNRLVHKLVNEFLKDNTQDAREFFKDL